jgi:hypothetical protein
MFYRVPGSDLWDGWACELMVESWVADVCDNSSRGFGQWMANSPMVIMWANADGTVTLSQRTAPREVMPTLDPNPSRVATLSNTLTSV